MCYTDDWPTSLSRDDGDTDASAGDSAFTDAGGGAAGAGGGGLAADGETNGPAQSVGRGWVSYRVPPSILTY